MTHSSRYSQLCLMSHTTGVTQEVSLNIERRTIVRTRGSLAFLGICEEGHSFCGSRTLLISPPFSSWFLSHSPHMLCRHLFTGWPLRTERKNRSSAAVVMTTCHILSTSPATTTPKLQIPHSWVQPIKGKEYFLSRLSGTHL